MQTILIFFAIALLGSPLYAFGYYMHACAKARSRLRGWFFFCHIAYYLWIPSVVVLIEWFARVTGSLDLVATLTLPVLLPSALLAVAARKATGDLRPAIGWLLAGVLGTAISYLSFFAGSDAATTAGLTLGALVWHACVHCGYRAWRLHAREKFRAGFCPCGYPFANLPTSVCPECGRDFHADSCYAYPIHDGV